MADGLTCIALNVSRATMHKKQCIQNVFSLSHGENLKASCVVSAGMSGSIF